MDDSGHEVTEITVGLFSLLIPTLIIYIFTDETISQFLPLKHLPPGFTCTKSLIKVVRSRALCHLLMTAKSSMILF